MSAIYSAFAAGQAQWPEIRTVGASEYQLHVSKLGVTETDLVRHGVDLFLALACGASDPVALRVLKQNYLPGIGEYLAHSGFDASSRDDALQQMLLYVCAGPNPRILGYAGRASLGTWLRVSTFRLAVHLSAKDSATKTPGDKNEDYLLQLVDQGNSPETRVLVDNAQELFQRALDSAMTRISGRERTLLRLCFRDGLSIDAIGTLYSVHRATAARWVVQIRKKLLLDVKTQLLGAAVLNESEFESLAAMVRSNLHISISRVLGAA